LLAQLFPSIPPTIFLSKLWKYPFLSILIRSFLIAYYDYSTFFCLPFPFSIFRAITDSACISFQVTALDIKTIQDDHYFWRSWMIG